MELKTAIQLIQGGVLPGREPQAWADLGAGRGLFTHALSTLLAPGSVIHAIDQHERDLQQIQVVDSVALQRHSLDFREELALPELDGILLANSLHFVQDQVLLLSKLKNFLKEDGRMILVEYELSVANTWVPYPVGYEKLKSIAKKSGMETSFCEEVPSLYHDQIYSAVVKRPA